jgi:hypothetical protein
MAAKLLIPILLGTICMLRLVTASENANFKHSQVISMPTATAEKNTLVLLTQVISLENMVTNLNCTILGHNCK